MDENLQDNFYEKYEKWHKRVFASSHKMWHNSWLTKAISKIHKAAERAFVPLWYDIKYIYFLNNIHIKNIYMLWLYHSFWYRL